MRGRKILCMRLSTFDKYIDMGNGIRRFKERENKPEKSPNQTIINAINEISKLQEDKGVLQLEQDKIGKV